jgi:transcriptional regulator with XRE-family HTH domain
MKPNNMTKDAPATGGVKNVELRALGTNIRTARESLKISQEAFADMCGLHRTYISDVERGARNVSFVSLLKLAQGLGKTVSELTLNVEPCKPAHLKPDSIHSAAQISRTTP